MGRIAESPHWEWWLVGYFFLGGIAAGSYFIATLIDLFGSEEDREVAKVAYYIAFPLIALCGIFLIVDLGRPDRFWHLLIQSKTGLPMFKWWSPISFGSWGLSLFGAVSFLSFVGVLAEDGRFGLGRFRNWAHYLHRGPIGLLFQIVACFAGFFIAAYTGALLTASNQPIWRDSELLASLFLASAASTGIATMILLRRRNTSHRSLAKLELADALAIAVELIVIVGFFISLGALATTFALSSYGLLMLVCTVLLGLIVPLALRFQPVFGRSTPLVAASLVLVGGLVLRYSILFAGQHLTIAGR